MQITNFQADSLECLSIQEQVGASKFVPQRFNNRNPASGSMILIFKVR